MTETPAGCGPQCPPGFHYHVSMGHTAGGAVANYEAGQWRPADPSLAHAAPAVEGDALTAVLHTNERLRAALLAEGASAAEWVRAWRCADETVLQALGRDPLSDHPDSLTA